MDDKPAQAPLADAPYPAYGRPAKARRKPIWRTVLAIVVVIAIAALAAFGLKQCAGGGPAGELPLRLLEGDLIRARIDLRQKGA